MSFTVYVLYSEKANKHYTGFTNNLAERLHSHNDYGKDWTAAYRPWRLIYSKQFDLKADAMKYEKWLKSGVGRNYIKRLPH
ncbi:MAG: GIY-YIG nuclease family protein [Chitinophagaceae bacterium]|nr:GIY-YIG nuclease family protein [Chitinophagaceae bacterium]